MKVSEEEYYEFLKSKKGDIQLHSSFTDVDGTAVYGLGYPAFETVYSLKDKGDVLACSIQGMKESPEESEWEYAYYIYK